jgi:hypothetical protein
MAFDYATTLTRLRVFLMDSSSAIWADADLQGSIRMAVGETSLYAGSTLTLSGLDGAGATTIPTALETALLSGSAGYAAAARTADRAENFELNGEADALAKWAAARLEDWRGMLAAQYPNAAAVSDDIAARELAADTRLAERELDADTRLADRELAADTRLATREEDAATRTAAREDSLAAAEAARVNGLRTSSNSAWGEWSDDFGERSTGNE